MQEFMYEYYEIISNKSAISSFSGIFTSQNKYYVNSNDISLPKAFIN
ncbi:MAG: hypothetical protein Q8920_03640 [Bacillota bacterium]|nr:hypothetical protein [Bacillota bacterium]